MAIESRESNLFHKFLSINTFLSKVAGTFDNRNSLKNPMGVIALFFMSLWLMGQWYLVFLHSNINEEITIRSISSIFSGYLAATKGLSLIFQSQNLRKTLEILSIMWADQYEMVKNRSIMLTMARSAYRITSVYFISCVVISAAFHLNPYKNFLYQYFWTKTENNSYNLTTVFQTEYPMDVNYLGIYIPVIIAEHITMIFILTYLISSDTLFCQLLTHLCLHFKLLGIDVENIVNKLRVASMSNSEKREGLQKLSKIVKRQNELYSLARRVERVFRPIFFVSMLTTSITICLTLYQIQRMIEVGQFWQGIGQLSYSIILLSEVAIYCGCSSMLSHEAELVAIAAYNCPWPYLGKQFCSDLQFLMLRAQKTFRCTAYGFFRLDLPQLSRIVSTAMTYFTLLNSLVKQK